MRKLSMRGLSSVIRFVLENKAQLSFVVYITWLLWSSYDALMHRLSNIESRMDQITGIATNCVQTEISKLRSEVWTVGMQELYTIWEARHNTNGAYPSVFATQKEASKRNPNVDRIPRLIP